jgi:hypothetical protein
LRLGVDGSVLAASHGTKRLTEFELDKVPIQLTYKSKL